MHRPTLAAALAALLATTAPANAQTISVVASAWSALKSIGTAIARNNGGTGQVQGSAADRAAIDAQLGRVDSRLQANVAANARALSAYKASPTAANKARLDATRRERRSLAAERARLREQQRNTPNQYGYTDACNQACQQRASKN